MTAPLIHRRILRPDGSIATSGPLWPDVRAEVERDTGQPWWMLETLGWRVVDGEPVTA